MAVGNPNSYGRFGGVGAGHQAAVAYGALDNGAAPYSAMANYGGYGAPMQRPGTTAIDPSNQVSTQTSSKGEVSAQEVQKNIEKALTAAGQGKRGSAAIYLARAAGVLNRKSAQGYGLEEYVQQAKVQVEELLAAYAAAQGGSAPADGGYTDDQGYTEEFIEEAPKGMSTGAKLALGALGLAIIGAGVVAATQ